MMPRMETGARFAAIQEDGGYVRVEWDQGVSVTTEDAQELIDCLTMLSPAAPAPMLVNLNDMVIVSASALSLFASELEISALALVRSIRGGPYPR